MLTEHLYTASKAKNHPNTISKTVFIYVFLQEHYQFVIYCYPKIVRDYDQKKTQSQTAEKLMAQRGRATPQTHHIRKTN